MCQHSLWIKNGKPRFAIWGSFTSIWQSKPNWKKSAQNFWGIRCKIQQAFIVHPLTYQKSEETHWKEKTKHTAKVKTTAINAFSFTFSIGKNKRFSRKHILKKPNLYQYSWVPNKRPLPLEFFPPHSKAYLDFPKLTMRDTIFKVLILFLLVYIRFLRESFK